VSRFIPAGKYLFKYDGSIGEGAELVIHPMTLQYLNTLNLRGMLADLSNMGVRSYKSGLCGLHVHISRDSFGDTGKRIEHNIRKLHQFFFRAQDQLLQFSKRKREQLDQWAAIEVEPSAYSRYRAINTCNDETVEIRIFRGTLDYDRLWASLQFCEAIVYFARNYGMLALASWSSWSLFREYVDKSIYGALRKYFNKHFGGVTICA
jgi:hypothetical protein